MNEEPTTVSSVFTDWRLYLFLLVVLLPCLAYWLLADGHRDDAVGEQLEQAVTTQREISSGINDAEKRTVRISEGIDRTIRQADAIGASLDTAGAIIADCQEILRGVRQRAEAETKEK